MICEQCSEKDASVHLTQVIDGQVKKLHLCEECAAQLGFEIEEPMSMTNLLLGMDGGAPTVADPELERSCPKCHMRKSDFRKTGQFGCPSCYEAFEQELTPLLKAMHRGERHLGKVPEREGIRVQASAKLEGLKRALDKAVTAEQFEEAANLRDQIRDVEEKLESAELEGSA